MTMEDVGMVVETQQRVHRNHDTSNNIFSEKTASTRWRYPTAAKYTYSPTDLAKKVGLVVDKLFTATPKHTGRGRIKTGIKLFAEASGLCVNTIKDTMFNTKPFITDYTLAKLNPVLKQYDMGIEIPDTPELEGKWKINTVVRKQYIDESLKHRADITHALNSGLFTANQYGAFMANISPIHRSKFGVFASVFTYAIDASKNAKAFKIPEAKSLISRTCGDPDVNVPTEVITLMLILLSDDFSKSEQAYLIKEWGLTINEVESIIINKLKVLPRSKIMGILNDVSLQLALPDHTAKKEDIDQVPFTFINKAATGRLNMDVDSTVKRQLIDTLLLKASYSEVPGISKAISSFYA